MPSAHDTLSGSAPAPSLTKILATLGPATDSPKTLEKIIEAGASLFRLNMSHGSADDHARRLALVRETAGNLGRTVAVLGDLPGPKIRLTKVADPGFEVVRGQDVIVRGGEPSCRPATGTARSELAVLGCNYADIAREVKPGHRVLINDGAIRMLAVESEGGQLLCRVTVGGLVSSNKGLNLPNTDLTIPALTDRDWEWVIWAVEHRLDYLALSFVRRAEDVRQLRERLAQICTPERCGHGLVDASGEPIIPIVAKIETPQAVRNIDPILSVSDAIMVARGDLGVEMDLAQVPTVQKKLIAAAHRRGKPAIVATQMLESMISSASPTRAEVSDVANAILDGADAVMLSGETAVGKYPILAVDAMRRVAIATEESLRERGDHERRPAASDLPAPPPPPADLPTAPAPAERQILPALALGAWTIAQQVGAKLVVIWSQRGGGARYLSRHDFGVPILAFSSDPHAVRRMCLLFGVFPQLLPGEQIPEHRSDFAKVVDRLILDHQWATPGDPVVFLAGKPLSKPGTTNTVSVRFVGDLALTE
ncbi:MAG: pyruvate kinase [Phycisphaerales bacterium]|nr:pyruvate kinase [Phycisphaerales bacterium]